MEGRGVIVRSVVSALRRLYLIHSISVLASDVTSSDSVIYVSVYDRSKAGEGFLGVKEIKPVLRDGCTIDNWFALSPRGDEKVTGEIWLQISYDAVKVGVLGRNVRAYSPTNCLFSAGTASVDAQRFRNHETHRQGYLWKSIPGPKARHQADLRYENALQKGHCREKGDRAYDWRTQDLAAIARVSLPGRLEVQFPDRGILVLHYRLQEWRRIVLAFAKGRTVHREPSEVLRRGTRACARAFAQVRYRLPVRVWCFFVLMTGLVD